MEIAVFGNESSWYVDDLRRAAQAGGHACRRVDFRDLTASATGDITAGEVDLRQCDAVIVRTMPPGSLEQVVYRMDVLARLEAAGVAILNPPKAIELAVDKYHTTARLAAADLPVPRTITCENSDQGMIAFEQLGGDVVVKPLFGAEGRGIVRVSDPDLAFRTFRTLERLDSVLYLQEFIEHEGFDIRVLMLDGEVVGAIRRSNGLDFRTNISREGIAEPWSYTDQEEDLARRAAGAVLAPFAGVDILYKRDGTPFVIEVNAVPGWRAFGRATGIDVAARVIGRLESPG